MKRKPKTTLTISAVVVFAAVAVLFLPVNPPFSFCGLAKKMELLARKVFFLDKQKLMIHLFLLGTNRKLPLGLSLGSSGS